MPAPRSRSGHSPPSVRYAAHPALILPLALLVSYLLAGTWREASRTEGIDYYQFWVVGRALARGQGTDVYSTKGRERLGLSFLEEARRGGSAAQRTAAEHRRVLDTYATPFLYTVARVATTDDYEVSLRLHQGVSIAAFVAATLVLGHWLGYPLWATLALLALMLAWFDPLASDLRVGNVNALQFAGLTVFLWMRRENALGRELAAGAVLVLAVLYKPNLAYPAALIGLLWLFGARWQTLSRVALGAGAGAAAAVGASVAVFGSWRCWSAWFGALRALPDAIVSVDLGNFSPARLAAEWSGMPSWPVALLFGGAGVILAWRLARSRNGGPAEIPAVAAGAVVGLLGAKLAWEHYYVLTVPMLLVALRPAELAETGPHKHLRRLAGALAFAGVSVKPLMALAPTRPTAFFAGLAVAGCLLLLIAALAEAGSSHHLYTSQRSVKVKT